MSRESLWDEYLQEQWDEKHGCRFTVDVPVNLIISVDGFDTEEVEDLHDRIDSAITTLCESLYHDKKTNFFSNMERDMENVVTVRDVE